MTESGKQNQMVQDALPDTTLSEPIRLVIWDLDETFWDGTLTEGGIQYRQDHHDMVIELARRGIMSSICSKNEQAQIEAILRERGLWDYFVFPSINWEPKGHRVAAIVEAIQLRAPSILFVDDSPMNLEEVRFNVPGINVSLPGILERLIDLPQCTGKDDSTLKRLGQYKLLEEKQAALVSAGGDNIDFLRSSEIRVAIEYDVESKIDRAVELINRTNQLNFTKNRLPEDPDEARAALLADLRQNTAYAGIVSVSDKFGDYGDVGIFLADRRKGLVHFCFSCRCLNMHVERWVYEHIGRPRFKVAGEVLSDIFVREPEISWITLVSDTSSLSTGADLRKYDAIYASGGCDIASLMHYFSAESGALVHEANFQRDAISIRLDHSEAFIHALNAMTDEQLQAAVALGYRPEDFSTAVFDAAKDIAVISFWADSSVPVYRDKESGLVIPFWLIGAQARNLVADNSLDEVIVKSTAAQAALDTLRSRFTHVGLISDEHLERNYRQIFKTLSGTKSVVLLLANELGKPDENGIRHRHNNHTRINRVARKVASQYSNTIIVDPAAFIGDAEAFDFNHFDRMVYFRIYEHISSKSARRLADIGKGQADRPARTDSEGN